MITESFLEVWIYNHYNDQREIVRTKEDSAAIGRDDGNDVVLRSPFVSRRHARIFKETGSYFIEALSLNETTVVNKILPHRQKRKIEYGDEIRVGEFSLYMMEAKDASRRMHGAKRVVSARKRVIEMEQKMHGELLERLNLRVTGQLGAADAQHVTLIKRHLSDIIAGYQTKVDTEMAAHLVREFLWRGVVTEVCRRATGKLLYSYGFESSDIKEDKHEETIARMISDVIGDFNLHCAARDERGHRHDRGRLARSDQEARPPDHPRPARLHRAADALEGDRGTWCWATARSRTCWRCPTSTKSWWWGGTRSSSKRRASCRTAGEASSPTKSCRASSSASSPPVGRRIDRSSPLVDARLPDGSRVNAIINPLSLSGPVLTIRKFARIPFTIDDLIERGTLSEAPPTSFAPASWGGRTCSSPAAPAAERPPR